MSKTDLARADLGSITSLVSSPFFDGWIVMLALGGIAHIQHIPRLALDYWTCVLIQLIALALLPQVFSISRYLSKIVEKL